MAGKYGLGYDEEAHYDTGEPVPRRAAVRRSEGQAALFGEDQRRKREPDHSDDEHRLKPGLAKRRH